LCLNSNESRLSSGSIVSDYGLDDRAIGVRSPAGAKDFSSILCVKTCSGTHPASCPMATGGPFSGGKVRPGRDVDHSLPSSAEVVNEYELYLLSPQAPPWRVAGLLSLLNSDARGEGLYPHGRRKGGTLSRSLYSSKEKSPVSLQESNHGCLITMVTNYFIYFIGVPSLNSTICMFWYA
jgi:hypothetical protein